MLKTYLDRTRPGTYLAGMRAYFAKFAFGNSQPSDFWGAVSASSSIADLASYMSSYTDQVGYPLLTVSWADPSSASTGVGVLTVSQGRSFLSTVSAAAAPAGSAATTWWVPLTIRGQGSATTGPVADAIAAANAQGGFTTRTWATTIGTAAAPYDIARDGWVKLGVNASGYARVMYPSNVWAAYSSSIAAQLSGGGQAGPLWPSARGQLVGDYFAFAFGRQFAGQGITMESFLAFVDAWLPLEASYEAWTPAVSALLKLRAILIADAAPLAPDACVTALNAVAARYLSPIAAQLNFTGGDQSALSVLMRSSVLSAASAFGVPAVVAQANQLFASGFAALPANIQTTVMASAVRWAPDASAYNAVRAAYLATSDSSLQRRYLTAMAASRDPALLASLLADSLNKSVVRTQDSVSVIVSVAGNAVGRALAWQFVQTNWAELNLRYGSGGFALSDLVYGTTAGLTTQAGLNQVSGFFTVNPIPGAILDWQQSMEMIGTNIQWIAGDRAATCAWLTAHA